MKRILTMFLFLSLLANPLAANQAFEHMDMGSKVGSSVPHDHIAQTDCNTDCTDDGVSVCCDETAMHCSAPYTVNVHVSVMIPALMTQVLTGYNTDANRGLSPESETPPPRV